MLKTSTTGLASSADTVETSSSQQIRRSDCTVQAVKVATRSLYLKIDGRWCGVESKDHLLDNGLCILVDTEHSGIHFASTYEALWPGDPSNNSAPCRMTGGTNSPVVAMLMEQWVALRSPRPSTKLAVPSVDAAKVALPALRASRHTRC